MLIENPDDYERIEKETGLTLKAIYGIKGKLRKDGRLPISKGEEKKGDETKSGGVAPEEQMYSEMKAVLEEELDITPGITSTSKSKEYILNRFMQEEVYRTNPTELFFLISKAAPQVKDWGVREIVTRVFNVTKNYNLDRMKLGAYMPRDWFSQPNMPSIPFYPERSSGWGMSQGYYTQEQFNEALRKEREQDKIDKLTETVTKLAETVDRLSKGDYQKPISGIIERTYVDPERGQVTERILPSGQSSESEYDKMLKMKEIMKSDLTPEQIRAIVKEEVPVQQGEPPALTEMKIRLNESEKKFEELKDKMNETDRKHLEDTINELKADIRAMGGGSGWHEDGMRVIGEGLSTIARKEPVKFIVQAISPAGSPREKVVESAASEGLSKKLPEKFVSPS